MRLNKQKILPKICQHGGLRLALKFTQICISKFRPRGCMGQRSTPVTSLRAPHLRVTPATPIQADEPISEGALVISPLELKRSSRHANLRKHEGVPAGPPGVRPVEMDRVPVSTEPNRISEEALSGERIRSLPPFQSPPRCGHSRPVLHCCGQAEDRLPATVRVDSPVGKHEKACDGETHG